MKVYLVDDHPIVIDGYKALLKAHGINVVGFSTTGQDLIDWLENNFCDILILDLQMPYFSGLDVLKYLNEKNSRVKVIIVTSYGDAAIIQKVINLGARGYILKDEASDCIVKAIRDVNNGKTYFSEYVRDAIIDLQLETSEEVLITDVLSKKETEVLKFLIEGFDTDAICEEMEIKPTTLRSYKERIRKNLGVNNNIQMALVAVKHKAQLFLKKKS
ncbi:conserved protein of unknown function [Tenacibaculum sp. 190130A14a]|uniref:DNA-binding response regulator n=1 Tax=Tenacibaculum polynesiense TaxID=3137857 RepID=A0ABM9P796_9FLAO